MEIPGLHIRAPDGNDPLTLILYNWERLSGLPTGEPQFVKKSHNQHASPTPV